MKGRVNVWVGERMCGGQRSECISVKTWGVGGLG